MNDVENARNHLTCLQLQVGDAVCCQDHRVYLIYPEHRCTSPKLRCFHKFGMVCVYRRGHEGNCFLMMDRIERPPGEGVR